MTLSTVQIQTIRSLRSEGLAYKKIAKQLGESVGSVFKYSSDVALSDEQLMQLKANEYGAKRLFVSEFAKPKVVKAPQLNEDFANLLGHLFFDGHVCYSKGKYIIGYTNSTYAAIEKFSEKLNACFGLEPAKTFKIHGGKIGWYQLAAYSKNAYLLLKQIARTFSTSQNAHIPTIIFEASQSMQSAFLRAFWDDEGCISNDGIIVGVSKSEPMIDDLISLHKNFRINCYKTTKKRKKYGVIFEITINRNKENYGRFIDFSGFEHANVTRGYNIGKAKNAVLLEKFKQLYGNNP